MFSKWRFWMVCWLVIPASFGQDLVFKADTILMTTEQLYIARCIQVGLYVTSTSAITEWSHINATLDYSDPNGIINGTPFVKVANMDATVVEGISNPGKGITNSNGGSTPCLEVQIFNAATAAIRPETDFLTGNFSGSGLLFENVDVNNGRVALGVLSLQSKTFTLQPGVEYLFGIIEFPLFIQPGRSYGDFTGTDGIQINFTPNETVIDGNIVSNGVTPLVATTENGEIVVLPPNQRPDSPGLFRPSENLFIRDHDRNYRINFSNDSAILMGGPGDKPLTGHWNDHIQEDLGFHQTNTFSCFFLDSATPTRITVEDRQFYMGATTDIAIRGDWSGDDRDQPGLFRPSNNQFFLDINDDGAITAADEKFFIGAPGDIPITGDWDGDGSDDVGVFRPTTNFFYLDLDGSRNITASDRIVVMGAAGDLPLAGDWNGDGTDEVGLFRPSTNRFYLDFNNDGLIRFGDLRFSMGAPGDLPITGKW